MKTSKQIVAIERCVIDKFNGTRHVSNSQVVLNNGTEWNDICFHKPAQLTVSNSVEDKQLIYTVKLTFDSMSELDSQKYYVYRIKEASGRWLLIGNDDRPYPVTTYTNNHPASISDKQANEYIVSYKNSVPVPQIEV